jgi:hypothetical protein
MSSLFFFGSGWNATFGNSGIEPPKRHIWNSEEFVWCPRWAIWDSRWSMSNSYIWIKPIWCVTLQTRSVTFLVVLFEDPLEIFL